MQASLGWIPPSGTLGRLVAEARERVRALESRRAELESAVANAYTQPSFSAALRRADVAVIAEIKRRSPSKGAINEGLSATEQARAYERGGAAALSVLTEPDSFGGSATDLEDVRRAVRLPLLKKDFHVDPIQVLEARALGASALLLIVRALDHEQLPRMLAAARDAGIEALVEIRDAQELARALDAGASLIGVNNRNLETLVIDETTMTRVIPEIPGTLIAIAESGMRSMSDVQRAAAAGADAALVGSSISAAADAAAAVRALTGVPRVGRA